MQCKSQIFVGGGGPRERKLYDPTTPVIIVPSQLSNSRSSVLACVKRNVRVTNISRCFSLPAFRCLTLRAAEFRCKSAYPSIICGTVTRQDNTSTVARSSSDENMFVSIAVRYSSDSLLVKKKYCP